MSEKNSLIIALALIAGYIIYKKGKRYSNVSGGDYVPNRAPAPEEGGEVNSGPIPEDYKSKKNEFYENVKTGAKYAGYGVAGIGATVGGIYLYKKGHLRTAGTKLKEGYEYAKTGVKNILQARKEYEKHGSLQESNRPLKSEELIEEN